MAAPPLRTEISDTYPLPSDATARAGFGKLWDYVTGLLGATGNAAEARAALGVRADSQSTARLLGRTTAGAGVSEEISVGTGLSLAAGVLSSTVASVSKYDSGNQTITSSGTLTLAHSLPSKPNLVQLWLKCTAADAGYSVGDEILAPMTVSDSAADNRGAYVSTDATNVVVGFGSAAGAYVVTNKGTRAASLLTNSSWAVIVRAWVL